MKDEDRAAAVLGLFVLAAMLCCMVMLGAVTYRVVLWAVAA